jgi:hypothetical protein
MIGSDWFWKSVLGVLNGRICSGESFSHFLNPPPTANLLTTYLPIPDILHLPIILYARERAPRVQESSIKVSVRCHLVCPAQATDCSLVVEGRIALGAGTFL